MNPIYDFNIPIENVDHLHQQYVVEVYNIWEVLLEMALTRHIDCPIPMHALLDLNFYQ